MTNHTELLDFIRTQDTLVDSMSAKLGDARKAVWDVEEITRDLDFHAKHPDSDLRPEIPVDTLKHMLNVAKAKARAACLEYQADFKALAEGVAAFTGLDIEEPIDHREVLMGSL